jgi:hypothetical protein
LIHSLLIDGLENLDMKRCPECNSVFSDADGFCELDGTPLVAADLNDYATVSDLSEQKIPNVLPIEMRREALQPRESWRTIAIVAVAGLAIGLVLFVVLYALTRQTSTENANLSSSPPSVTQRQAPILPPHPSPVASASPSVEPSASPSAIPSPSPQTDSARVELSSSEISTGEEGKNKSGPVIIRLLDGASIEADQVWRTSDGIWYRRGGIVTFVDPKQIKVIEKVVRATPQPSALQTHSP